MEQWCRWQWQYLVELLVELLELRDPAHDLLVHEVGRLQDRVLPLAQEGDAVVDQRLMRDVTTRHIADGPALEHAASIEHGMPALA